MPPAHDDLIQLALALEGSLREAGYADAADQIVRVLNEPIATAELPDGRDREPENEIRLEPANDEEDILLDPSTRQRFSAMLKILDLMVVEPLEIEHRLRSLMTSPALNAEFVAIGEGTAAVTVDRSPTDRHDALAAWRSLIDDLEKFVADV